VEPVAMMLVTKSALTNTLKPNNGVLVPKNAQMATANVLIAMIITVARLIQINRIHQKICYLMFSAFFIPNMDIFTIQLKEPNDM